MKSGSHYHQISVADFMKNFVPQTQEQLGDELDFSIDLRKFKPNSKTGKRDEKGCYSILCNYIDRALGSEGDGNEGNEGTNDGHFVCRNVSDWPDRSLMSETKSRGEAPAWSESLDESHQGDPGPQNSPPVSETLSRTDSDLLPPRRPNTRSGTERIDLAVFRVRGESGEKRRLPWAHSVKVKDDRQGEYATQNSYAYTLMGLEVKVKGDAWGKTASEFLPDTGIGSDFRGQVCEYVAEILARQHRTFFFTVSVYQTTARLMRWDRLGVIVSEPIDLEAEPKKFYEFFFRLRKATNVQLGFDPTATLISIDEYTDSHPSIVAVTEAITSLPRAASRIKPYISKAFTDGSWPYYELQVSDKTDSDKTHRFLVRNSSSHSRAPTGRATKGYIAFDLETRKFRFLKDSWRPDSPDVHPELEVYEKFGSVDPPIPCLATVCCGGDVFHLIGGERVKQATRTQEWIPLYHSRIHTRIVLNEVGLPLKAYTNSRELCNIVSQAMLAHAGAWVDAGVLHRDISDGNIVIYINYDDPTPTTTGLLIDWDLCKYRTELGNKSQRSRSGTWRFLSAALLNYPLKPNELADDLEAFYHVLSLFALRYHDHGMSTDDLKDILQSVFYAYKFDRGHWIGSAAKYRRMASGELPCELNGSSPFGEILRDMAHIIQQHYKSLHKTLEAFALPKTQTSGITPQMSSDPGSNQPLVQKSVVARYIDTTAAKIKRPARKPSVVAPAGERALDSHIELYAVLDDTLRDIPEENWDPKDKLPDQFALINWSSKRPLDYSDGGNTSKRSRTTASGTGNGHVPPLGLPRRSVHVDANPDA
ncbi:hypothetical protein BXZ70DRAFT_206800 [Cristinia sonorae]|uniref:Fungal-type protein kinase domain-containing protein n=1 Tax=Cristinia sonorae TaxID=1940300 RepID=A0A8K0UM66_9AGAR|nr:hypothetical protein BXZ70DRAFT_206800 [Cristinia sonorae]